MWGRKRKVIEPEEPPEPAAPEPGRLKEAVRQVRIESAERTSVVVDLRDAELARLELLDEALDPLFNEIPAEVDLFDRGISRGDPPRLWIDVVAHVVMGRDKRQYRFVQDMRYGRKVLAESSDIGAMVEAVTHYVANRLIERERALADQSSAVASAAQHDMRIIWRRRRWRWLRAFVFGLVMGCVALFGALWIVASRLPH
jgi:hypothetical protein